MTDLDPRLTPARGDLAAEYLRGTVEADNYVPALSMRIAVGSAPLRSEPRPDAPQLTEAIFGEPVAVYDLDEGWAWVQLETDRYVGWLPEWALGSVAGEPTHRVSALRTFIFPGASIKQPPEEALTLGSHVIVEREEGMFAVLATGGYVPRQHLVPLDEDEDDYVSVAERFLGAPYLWGGKTSLGLDCSGLVQVAFDAVGLDAPRDSDMQERGIGEAIELADAAGLQRGDLIFWKGHVAIARGDGTIIHANAHHMAVAIEDAAGAIARIAEAGSPVTSIRRL
jgi:cell wall-associated NlpC family hydrolase